MPNRRYIKERTHDHITYLPIYTIKKLVTKQLSTFANKKCVYRTWMLQQIYPGHKFEL